jgi:iron complex outermembrane receptor protein
MFKSYSPGVLRIGAAGLLAGCLLGVEAAHAQSPGRIVIAVADAAGGVLPGVTVDMRGPISRTAQTGLDGRTTFENLPSGEYELTSALSGFAPGRQSLRIVAGESSTVTVTLAVQLLEQVIVTADRTGARDLQATPMAVSALTGDDLAALHARTAEDIAGRVPAVTFSQNTGLAQLTIRGIGTNVVFAGSDPSSAMYLDGVYLARPAMAFADVTGLERIEVLRGPQGTLYGRNAMGGAVNLITRDPTNALDTMARVTAGTFDTLRAEARVSGPLARDRVMGSVAFLRGTSRGFVRDENHPDHPLGGEDQTTVRGKLLVVLNNRSDLLVSADAAHADPAPLTYAKVLAVKPGFRIDNPGDPHTVRASFPATSRNVQAGTSARVSVRLPRQVTFTSLTAYRALDYDVVVDTDITELNLTKVNVHEIHHQWSEEATVARQGSKATWVGGIYLFGDVDHQPTSVLQGTTLEQRLDATVESRATAAFGQATLTLSPRVSVTTGLRYTRERKTLVNSAALFSQATAVKLPGGFVYTDAISHDAWTPKAGVEVRVRPDVLAYASATRGFKSGGFNISSPEAGRGYAPEWAWSYEGGLKSEVGAGRVRLNLAAFHTDYTDLQVQTAIRPGVLDISNAAEAAIDGLEIEGTARLVRGTRVGGHLAWLDATYERYLAIAADTSQVDVAGRHLSNAPVWSGRVWIDWSRSVGRAGSLSVRADARRQSTVSFTPLNDTVQRQLAFGVFDLSARLTPARGRWALDVFVRNVGDANYITGTFSSPPPAIGGRPAEPRRIGISLEIRR